jgi:hypothetical protein
MATIIATVMVSRGLHDQLDQLAAGVGGSTTGATGKAAGLDPAVRREIAGLRIITRRSADSS